jgi:rhodanese-related sulfurtransferase
MIKNLLGLGPKVDMQQLIKSGAVIVDVRTAQEFASGHVKGSINIPLNMLPEKMKQLPKNKPIITCCASGMRSATAKNILQQQGFAEVYNGGSWARL